MSANAQEILDTILSRLKALATTDTVVGEPVTIGDITILPVIKISLGFAAGAGEGGGSDPHKGQGQGSGGGGGGGASVTPIGFITYDGKDIRFIAIGKGKIDSLIETVPELLKKLGLTKGGKSKEKEECET